MNKEENEKFVKAVSKFMRDLSDVELQKRHEQLNGMLRGEFAGAMSIVRDNLEKERWLVESEMVRRFKEYTPELTDPNFVYNCEHCQKQIISCPHYRFEETGRGVLTFTRK